MTVKSSKRGTTWRVASSNGSTSSPAPSTSVSPKRRKSLSKSQWEALKNPILELYRTHKLNHLMAIMKKEYLFDATEQMYKKKLSAWHGHIGGQKNIFYTKAQKRHMIKRYLTRKLLGKKTCFEMRTMGKLNALQTKKLQRALQRALEDPESIGVSGLIKRFQQIQLEKSSLCGLIRHASTCSTQGAGGLSRHHSNASQRSSVHVYIPSCRLKRLCSTNSRSSSCRDSIIDYTPPGSGTCSRSISLRLTGITPDVLSNNLSKEKQVSESAPPQCLARRPAVRLNLAKKLPRVQRLRKESPSSSELTFTFNKPLGHETEIEKSLKSKYGRSFDVFIDSDRPVMGGSSPTAEVRVVCNDCSEQGEKYQICKVVEIVIGTGSMNNMIGIKSSDIGNIGLEVASHLDTASHLGSENLQSSSFSYSAEHPQHLPEIPGAPHHQEACDLDEPHLSSQHSSLSTYLENMQTVSTVDPLIGFVSPPIIYHQHLAEPTQSNTTYFSQAQVPYQSNLPHHTHEVWSQDAFFAAPSLFSPSALSPFVTREASNATTGSSVENISQPQNTPQPQLSLIVPRKRNISPNMNITSWFDNAPELIEASNESSPSTKSPDDLFPTAYNIAFPQAIETNSNSGFHKEAGETFTNTLNAPLQWGPTSLEPAQVYLGDELLWQPPLGTGSIEGNYPLMSDIPTDPRRSGRYFSEGPFSNINEPFDIN